MKWIGLTGGIATGKSTLSKIVQSLGLPVIDADQISHQLTKKEEIGYTKIVDVFGVSVLDKDKNLDRKKMGQLVFSDKAALSQLEKILHPLIHLEVQKLRHLYSEQKNELCFYDVPLLFEKNLQSQFDYTVLVWCDSDLQRSRLRHRNHLNSFEIDQRLNSQLPLIYKVKNSDFCLDNSSDLEALSRQAKQLIMNLKRLKLSHK